MSSHEPKTSHEQVPAGSAMPNEDVLSGAENAPDDASSYIGPVSSHGATLS